jgi:hypothetical protein
LRYCCCCWEHELAAAAGLVELQVLDLDEQQLGAAAPVCCRCCFDTIILIRFMMSYALQWITVPRRGSHHKKNDLLSSTSTSSFLFSWWVCFISTTQFFRVAACRSFKFSNP